MLLRLNWSLPLLCSWRWPLRWSYWLRYCYHNRNLLLLWLAYLHLLLSILILRLYKSVHLSPWWCGFLLISLYTRSYLLSKHHRRLRYCTIGFLQWWLSIRYHRLLHNIPHQFVYRWWHSIHRVRWSWRPHLQSNHSYLGLLLRILLEQVVWSSLRIQIYLIVDWLRIVYHLRLRLPSLRWYHHAFRYKWYQWLRLLL